MAKLAVLDIGTNTIHLVLADVQSDFTFKVLDRFKDLTRLGDGVFSSGRLAPDNMTRGSTVIQTLVTLARNKGYNKIEAVATSAVREAKNGGMFIKNVSRKTGLRVRVVTGAEEARLIYLGIRHSMDLPTKPTLIVDIGGGSVELILCVEKELVFAESLKLGAIRLKDLYLANELPSPSSLKKLRNRITDVLSATLKRFRSHSIRSIIATSGMAGNLCEVIHLKRTGRPLSQLNLATITLKEIVQTERLLSKLDYTGRLDIPGLDPKRVDTLLPATMLLRVLMELVECKKVTISDKAIREGLIYDFIEKNKEGLVVESQIPNVRRRQVLSLARRCRYPATHSHHVAVLAQQLFLQTQRLHGLGEREREWLEYAAILHDIGYLIHSKGHHKHTEYLIRHSDLHGFSEEEIAMIAYIARYHRRALPKNSHDAFANFSTQGKRTIRLLSGMLRIADGLDRTHFSVIKHLNIVIGKKIVILLHLKADAELELWTAQRRAILLEKVLRRPIVIKVSKSQES